MSTLVKQSQSTVKQNNLRLILSTIIRHEPLSRADLVRRTQISKPTVSSLIDELLERGLISEIGAGPSRSGRKPILLRFESDRRRLLAFEMGRAAFRIALADLKGRILSLREGVFPPQTTPARGQTSPRLEPLGEAVVALLAETGTERNRLLKAICIAPGVYVEPGKALRWVPAGAAPGARTDPASLGLSGYFCDLLGLDVLLYHSTKAALLGERVAGKARGCSSALYVDFAYGLGCAIMIDGKVYSGPGDSAGEIGYFYSSPEEHRRLTVRPFELGALEQKISGKALADEARAELRKHPEGTLASLAGGEESLASARHVFEAYRAGDARAAAILKNAFSYFNTALCNVINLLAPERVILGGGFSESGDILLELIAPGICNRVLIPPRLEISELKNRASLIGGIHYLIEHTDFLTELTDCGVPGAAEVREPQGGTS
jgi:predicted NBD/HSP70 family sugar kinase